MIVLDVLALVALVLLVISYIVSKKDFLVWLFEHSGFSGYFLKAVTIVLLLATFFYRFDWSVLTKKLF
jgi:hypothetical protein